MRACAKGRVGTGLAYRYEPANGSEAERESKWSDPKLCSLTALVSPIPDRSQKAVVNMILFVCHPTGNKVFLEALWWQEISHSTGLLVIEAAPPTTSPKPRDDEDALPEDDDPVDNGSDSEHPSPGNDMSFRAAINLATVSSTEEYPVTRHLAPDGKDRASLLYYYAWQDDELLKDNLISLERVILMEMTPLPGPTVLDEANVHVRLDNLLKHPDVETNLDDFDDGHPLDSRNDQDVQEATNSDNDDDLVQETNTSAHDIVSDQPDSTPGAITTRTDGPEEDQATTTNNPETGIHEEKSNLNLDEEEDDNVLP